MDCLIDSTHGDRSEIVWASASEGLPPRLRLGEFTAVLCVVLECGLNAGISRAHHSNLSLYRCCEADLDPDWYVQHQSKGEFRQSLLKLSVLVSYHLYVHMRNIAVEAVKFLYLELARNTSIHSICRIHQTAKQKSKLRLHAAWKRGSCQYKDNLTAVDENAVAFE